MTTLKVAVDEAKTAAMQAKLRAVTDEEKDRAELELSVARGVLGAIEKAEMAGKTRKDLSETEVLNVLKSEAKTRRGSAEIYRNAGADDRADREAAEAEIIESFLPKAPTELELQYFIADYVGANGLEGSGKAAMGEVMKVLREEFSNFDGKTASALAAKILA